MTGLPIWMSLADRYGAVSEALAAVVERTTRTGAPWCPPGVARRLVDLIVDRNDRLAAVLRNAIRLGHLLRSIDGRNFWAPLHRAGPDGGIERLTTASFRHLVQRAAQTGRLGPGNYSVTGEQVLFRGDRFASRGGGMDVPATLAFAAMPLLAAVLALIQETELLPDCDRLFDELASSTGPGRTAHEIGGELARLFDGWLTKHLMTAHLLRQGRMIRSFLLAAGRYHPSLIDDETMLRFWERHAGMDETNRGDDFRRYVTTVRKLMVYRDEIERELSAASLSAPESIDPLLGFELAGLEASEAEGWRSPLRELGRPPASDIKWLTGTERRRLAHFLGVAGDAGDDGASGNAVEHGLAPGRLDLAFWLTLLRADVFSAVQNRLIQAKRDGIDPALLLAADGEEAVDAYRTQCQIYRDLHLHAVTSMLACLDVLARHDAAECAVLVPAVADEAAMTELRALLSAQCARTADGEAPEPAEVAALVLAQLDPGAAASAPAVAALLARAAAARKGLRRKGFEPERERELIASYVAAVEPLVELATQLGKLVAVLGRQSVAERYRADRERFERVFRSLYAMPRETV